HHPPPSPAGEGATGPVHNTQRQALAAAGSGSAPDAGGSQLHALVRCVPIMYDYVYICNRRDSKWMPLHTHTPGAISLKPWRKFVTIMPRSSSPAKISARS